MPWTNAKPPKPALGVSPRKRRACVAAANSTLERTGDEGAAVRACIAAMDKVKGDDMSDAENVSSEIKHLDFSAFLELKGDADDEGMIKGRASTFGGEPDSFGDVVRRGAFAATLREHAKAGSMPAMLWQHDTRQPLGAWLDVQETSRGLDVEGRLTMEVQQAVETRALLRDGAIKGLSIGYRTRESKPRKEGGRILTDVELLEVSIVTMPANTGAKVTAVKTAHDEVREFLVDLALCETDRERERLLRDAGCSRTEAKAIIAIGFKALNQRDAEDADNELGEVLATLRRSSGRLSAIAK